MTPTARALFILLIGVWVFALIGGVVRFRHVGVQDARRVIRRGAPLLDLVGTWLGTLAALALVFGRVGYTFGWAAALCLDALMVTASLYDRAVLLPSLGAALKRVGVGSEPEKWRGDFEFMWRMSMWGRAATAAMGLGAIACILAA